MKIRSLRLYNENMPLNKLFQIAGAVRNIIVISAYIDFKSIKQLIKYVDKTADTSSRPTLRIYIDKASSHYTADRKVQAKFKKANKEILKFCDSKSGIFLVQTGALFHSKAYLIEGNKKSKILFGSMNLTQNGLGKNEELVLYDDIEVNGNKKSNKLAKWIAKYADDLLEKSIKVGTTKSDNFPSSIRQLLLNGSIYYELKEQNPFRFKLYLPKEISKQKAGIDKLLEANITDSVSLEVLLSAPYPFGMGKELPEIGTSKAFWKKYCVETCYGYWNPQSLKKDLQATLKKKRKERKPYFEFIKKQIEDEDANILDVFLRLRRRIQDYLSKLNIIDWKYSDEMVAREAWKKWRENILNKIENKEYYNRLIDGVAKVPSPDVWSDPIASTEFEDSFCESVIYNWSKENLKETSNVVAQAIAWNLDLDNTEKDEMDISQLKNEIEKWLVENPDYSIIDYNEW